MAPRMIIISLLIIGASCSMYLPETPRNPGSSTSHPTLFGLCSDSADNIQVCSWNYDGTNQKLLHVLGTSGTIDPSMSAAFFDAKSNIYTTLIYNDTTFEPVSTIIRYDVSNDELLALPTSLDMYDIEVTVNGTAFALADSQTSDVRSIYRIDLDTGEATHVGDFNDYDGFFIGDWVLDSVLGIYYLLYTGADDSAIFLGMDVATGQLVTRDIVPSGVVLDSFVYDPASRQLYAMEFNETISTLSLVKLQTNPLQIAHVGESFFHSDLNGMPWLSPANNILYTQWLADDMQTSVVMTDLVTGKNIITWPPMNGTLYSVVASE